MSRFVFRAVALCPQPRVAPGHEPGPNDGPAAWVGRAFMLRYLPAGPHRTAPRMRLDFATATPTIRMRELASEHDLFFVRMPRRESEWQMMVRRAQALDIEAYAGPRAPQRIARRPRHFPRQETAHEHRA